MEQEILEPNFDIFMYAGRWYEIARLPNPWEISCIRSTADYYVDDRPLRKREGLLPELDIVNTCWDGQGDIIEQRQARGWIPDPQESGAIVVEFTGSVFPKSEKGWYLVHETDYLTYSVVGSPDRQYVWILSRSPTICRNVFYQLLDFTEQLGYDKNRIKYDEKALRKCHYEDMYNTDIPR